MDDYFKSLFLKCVFVFGTVPFVLSILNVLLLSVHMHYSYEFLGFYFVYSFVSCHIFGVIAGCTVLLFYKPLTGLYYHIYNLFYYDWRK